MNTNPLTTATSIGVAIRYVMTIVGSVLFILSTLGVVTPEQAAAIIKDVEAISGRLPELLMAVSGLVAIGIPVYATITKSSSDKAAEVAKVVDAQVPPSAPVEIVTPGAQPNIVVTPNT